MPTVQPHQYRQMAESFGTDAERYDRARPHYPDGLIAAIAGPGRDILDVGCGTGIVARQLRAAGCTVLGVEPDARMAEFAEHTGVDVEVSTFETWDAAGRTFDAVVAGQAWHWVDPVAGAARAAEVLRPNGSLTVFWHAFEPPAEVRDATTAAFHRAVPDSPFGRRPDMPAVDMYQTMVDRALAALGPEFGDQQRWRFEWTRHYTRAEWLDLLPTTGGLTRLPADKLADILDAVGAAIDDTGFTMTYTTLAGTAERLP